MPMQQHTQDVLRCFLSDFLNYRLSTRKTIPHSEMSEYRALYEGISTEDVSDFSQALQGKASIMRHFSAYIKIKLSGTTASWPKFSFFIAEISDPEQAKAQLQKIISPDETACVEDGVDDESKSGGSPLGTFITAISQFDGTGAPAPVIIPATAGGEGGGASAQASSGSSVAAGGEDGEDGDASAQARSGSSAAAGGEGGGARARSRSGSSFGEVSTDPLDQQTKTELKNFLTTFINWLYFAPEIQRELTREIIKAYYGLINYLDTEDQANLSVFVHNEKFTTLKDTHTPFIRGNDPFKVFISEYLAGNSAASTYIISSPGSEITAQDLYQLTQTPSPEKADKGRIPRFTSVIGKLDHIHKSQTRMQQYYTSDFAAYILAYIVLDLIDKLQTKEGGNFFDISSTTKISQKLRLAQQQITLIPTSVAEPAALERLQTVIQQATLQVWPDEYLAKKNAADTLRTELEKELKAFTSTFVSAPAQPPAATVETEAAGRNMNHNMSLLNIKTAFQAIIASVLTQTEPSQASSTDETPQLGAFEYYITKIQTAIEKEGGYNQNEINKLITLAELNLMQLATTKKAQKDPNTPTITLYIANFITLLEEFRSSIATQTKPEYSDQTDETTAAITERLKASPNMDLPDFDQQTNSLTTAVADRIEQIPEVVEGAPSDDEDADAAENAADDAGDDAGTTSSVRCGLFCCFGAKNRKNGAATDADTQPLQQKQQH